MKKTISIFAIFAISALASSCSVFSWLDNKTDEWGQSLPVSNEQRRCANAFCSEADYMKSQQQGAQQSAPQTMPTVPVTQVQQNNIDPSAQMQPYAAAPARFPSQPTGAQYQQQGQQVAIPTGGKMMTPDEFMAMQKSGGANPMGAMPNGMPQMPNQIPNDADIMAGGPAGLPNPYAEAGSDPRLQPNEANPDWKKDLPPIPEGMSSMRGLE